jgi:glyoxylate reductase
LTRAKVYITKRLPAEGLKRVRSSCRVKMWGDEVGSPRRVLLREVREAEGLFCSIRESVDEELLNAASRLKVVSNLGVGYDNIDVAAATRRGIPVGNTPGVLTDTTADLAFGLLMAASRRIVEGDRRVRAGKWKYWDFAGFLGEDVHGATLGIVGMGKIGTAVALRAKGFGMKIIYHDVVRREDLEGELGIEYAPLDELLADSDFVTIHTDLNQGTLHLMNAERIGLMKKTAILVNTSRGTIVDNMALYRALNKGTIRGAALDVTDPEPIPKNHPLLSLENVVVTPHIGSASTATRARMMELAVDNLLAGLKGDRLPHCVNPEVYGRNRT